MLYRQKTLLFENNMKIQAVSAFILLETIRSHDIIERSFFLKEIRKAIYLFNRITEILDCSVQFFVCENKSYKYSSNIFWNSKFQNIRFINIYYSFNVKLYFLNETMQDIVWGSIFPDLLKTPVITEKYTL
jgi:hypothetical protein